MCKLYFRYGTMASAKTLNLISVADTYEYQGKKVIVMKPAIDTRKDVNTVSSRSKAERKVDILIKSEKDIEKVNIIGVSCILVDESQFLKKGEVEILRALTVFCPVICYGLRTDYKGYLFEGSKRLMELADSIEEIKTTCKKCNKKALFNMRHSNGKKIDTGEAILLGAEESYMPVCYEHYIEI